MTKPNRKPKRALQSPEDSGNLPEKRSTVDTGKQCTTSENNMASPGYVQPLNMANMANMNSYQTPVGASYTPQQTPVSSQQPYIMGMQPQPMASPNNSQQSIPNFQQTVLDRLNSMDKRLSVLDSIDQ